MGRGSGGGVGSPLDLKLGWRMTGSAPAMDVAFSIVTSTLLRKGRGLGRGGAAIGPGRRLADDGKRFQAVDVACDVR